MSDKEKKRGVSVIEEDVVGAPAVEVPVEVPAVEVPVEVPLVGGADGVSIESPDTGKTLSEESVVDERVVFEEFGESDTVKAIYAAKVNRKCCHHVSGIQLDSGVLVRWNGACSFVPGAKLIKRGDDMYSLR